MGKLSPQGGGLWDPTSVGEGTEASLRVWKHLRNSHVLKLWAWPGYIMGQNREYLVEVGLDWYKWYRARHRTLIPFKIVEPTPKETRHFLSGCENISLVDDFKTMNLTTIRNRLKRTISARCELQMLHCNTPTFQNFFFSRYRMHDDIGCCQCHGVWVMLLHYFEYTYTFFTQVLIRQ